MKRTSLLALYYHNIKLGIAQAMQFRADFAIGVFSSLCSSILSVVIQFLVFRLTNGYPGWSVAEMMVFQGMFMFWNGIRDTLFGGVRDLIRRIMWKGEFDQILLRPFHSGGYLLVSGFDFKRIGAAAGGAGLLVSALLAAGVTVTFGAVLACGGLFVAGMALYLALTLFYCSLSMVVIHPGRFIELMDRLVDYSGYPSEIFPRAARVIYEVAVPFAVFICFPARALLGRLDWVMAAGAAVAVAFWPMSLLVWRLTVKKYTSAGG